MAATSEEIRAAYFEKWKSPYGAPDDLYVDMAKNHFGKKMLDPCNGEGSKVTPIAGEAHWQLDYVERHNGILAEAVRIGLDTVAITTEEEYDWFIAAILDAKNRMMRRWGFAPYKIAFGREPKLPSSLLHDEVSPGAVSAAIGDPGYARAEEIRAAAHLAVLKAADSRALKSTVNIRPRPYRPFCRGDLCY